ncbi:helix-turn-helix transcriptional regulator [Myroides sp. JBRI-B21084]|uniref:helix-turn-helix domain-containing protein n=1 Tax=Myroides sp. JBRI-B21084 TaxID=3119977 RepID=UPI0026E47147|nr:helix-turn-helix transcriptional regulator [Paenimyroides cloacae]WKW46572.1 helix-turn-helix transcriptional regulator [Paenimyroides cloacae]
MEQAYLKLKKLRKQKKITQSDIAEKIGLSTRAYSKIENGETQLTVDRLTEILDILETSIIDFFKMEEESKLNNTPIIEHYQETITLLKEHINTLKNVIDKKND